MSDTFLFRSLNKENFETLRTLIVKAFPSETEATYYTPAFKSQVARGKLYSAYTFYRQ